MTDQEAAQACQALINWLRSQGIEPADAVPVLALGIATAVISVASAHQAQTQALDSEIETLLRSHITTAANSVIWAYHEMRKRNAHE